jgi:hypothetical protein
MFKPIGIFLLSLFLFSQVYNTTVWLHYQMNVDEITELFCENTSKPEMNCHGVCHLKKQIIQTDQNIPIESESVFYLNEIQLFSTQSHQEILIPSSISILHRTIFKSTYSHLQESRIFHPPKVS